MLSSSILLEPPNNLEKVHQYKWLPMSDVTVQDLYQWTKDKIRFECRDRRHRDKWIAACENDWEEV